MRSDTSFVKRASHSRSGPLVKSTIFTTICAAVLAAFPVSHVLAAPPDEGVGCIRDMVPAWNKLNCTANDTTLSSPVVTIIDACDYPGDTATVQVLVDITVGAQTRNDLAVWLSVDGDPNGDGSETGMCSVLTVPNNVLHSDGVTSTLGDTDVCGDVFNMAIEPHILSVDMGTVTVPCIDTDGDGRVNTPLIVAWNQNDSALDCSTSSEALPGTKAKCGVNLDAGLDVPVPARIIVAKQTQPQSDTTSFDFHLTGPDSGFSGGFDGSHDFSLAHGDTFDSAIFTGGLPAGEHYVVSEDATSYISSGFCTTDFVGGTNPNTDPSDIDLNPGETVSCVFTNSEEVPPATALLRLAKTWSGAIPGDAISATTSGLDSNATLSSITSGNDTDLGAPVLVTEGDVITLNAETFVTGSAANYTTSSWVCESDGEAADRVVAPGETLTILESDDETTITCTVTNTIAVGRLTVTKIVVGGAMLEGDFPLFVDATSVTSGVENIFAPDDYTVSETGDSEYEATTGGDCASDGSVTLAAGDVKACTITNRYILPPVEVIPVPVNNALALFLLMVMTLGVGWYFRPEAMR